MLTLHAQGCSILYPHFQTMSIEAQAAQDAHPLSSRKSSTDYCLLSLNGAIFILYIYIIYTVALLLGRRGFAYVKATNR